MAQPLIAVIGHISSQRLLDPPLAAPATARVAAEALGAELAKRGARLLVYGGPYLEADVVRGYVGANPRVDRGILMWYSEQQAPPPFAEEKDHDKLFQRRVEKGADWETSFYRSVTAASGIILMGGGNATKISGLIAIGARIPLLALHEFGGGAAKVWSTLAAGEDLPTREEIDVMANPWGKSSASACIDVLFAQAGRRHRVQSTAERRLTLLAAILFIGAIAIIPGVWGGGDFKVWMLFLAPLLAGGAGASIRPAADRLRSTEGPLYPSLATVVLGLLAGGIAGVLFVTAQLTGDPQLAGNAATVAEYARRSIPYAMAVGFIAGLTADAVFGRLFSVDVVRTSGIGKKV